MTAEGYHLTPEAEQTVMFTPDVAVIKLNMKTKKEMPIQPSLSLCKSQPPSPGLL